MVSFVSTLVKRSVYSSTFMLFLAFILVAYMVRRTVPACVEDYVCSDAKFPCGGDASNRTAGHGGNWLPVLQYSRIQSKTTRRSSPEGGPADRVTQRRLRRTFPFVIGFAYDSDFLLSQPFEYEHAAMRSRAPYLSVV